MRAIVYTVNIIVFVVAVSFAWITVSQLRNTSATYNARLLPFAYYSLICWIFWVLQYLVAIARETQQEDFLFNIGIFTKTIYWMGFVQTALLIVAVLSLYSKQPPRLSLTLPFLIVLSVLAALLSYGTPFHILVLFNASNSILLALIFVAFVPSILKFRLSKVFAVVFIIYGLAQLTGLLSFRPSSITSAFFLLVFPLLRFALLFSWGKMIVMLLQRAQTSYERVVKEIKSLELLPNPTATFGVMISSTVNDLPQERDATDRAIRALHLDRFRAETFGSLPHTPRKICEFMANYCDLFILIIGQRYGHVIEPERISVVEFEYEVAHAQNPQKILVYVKNGVEREPRLQGFLQKVQDFEVGYFRSSFDTPEELYERIHIDIARWLVSQTKPKVQTERRTNIGMQQNISQSPADA